jgi:hypothetical protein
LSKQPLVAVLWLGNWPHLPLLPCVFPVRYVIQTESVKKMLLGV